MRLNRFLAAAGAASRRGADAMIAAGRVTVNGRVCREYHFQPGPRDYVKLDGKTVRPAAHLYVVLNKPAGFVCTRQDPHSTDTVYDLLPVRFSSLKYVGRLDAQSEGLLLLTNDGDFVQRFTHPKFRIEKEYDVRLDRPATERLRQQLVYGTALDGKHGWVSRVHSIAPGRIRVVLEQGLNRQIRRMLQRFGFNARRLIRIRIGNLCLHGLASGKWRYLTRRELMFLWDEKEQPSSDGGL